MRKLLCAGMALLFMMGFTACTMRGDGLELYDDKTPYEVEVYMQVPIDRITANWAQFEQTVKNDIEATNISRENYFTNATVTVDLEEPSKDGDIAVFTISIKIDSVKQKASNVRSDLLYRYQTVTMFNPLNVLKPVDDVVYYFGAAWETRITEVPNAVPSRDEDGNYQYIWYGNSPQLQWDWQNGDIVLYNKYANTPTWYAGAVIISAAIGVIVYFACKGKKKEHPLP
jgi:hypothetical protein